MGVGMDMGWGMDLEGRVGRRIVRGEGEGMCCSVVFGRYTKQCTYCVRSNTYARALERINGYKRVVRTRSYLDSS